MYSYLLRPIVNLCLCGRDVGVVLIIYCFSLVELVQNPPHLMLDTLLFD